MLLLLIPRPPSSPLFPYTTLFRSHFGPRGHPANRQRCLIPSLIPQLDIQNGREGILDSNCQVLQRRRRKSRRAAEDRKSTRLNSSHSQISYAVFCLKKKKKTSTPE